MRSYTEVNPGNSRNWVKFGGTVQGNPGTIWGYPGTILGYPGTIWGNPGTIRGNPGTDWNCLGLPSCTYFTNANLCFFFLLQNYPCLSMKNKNSLKCNSLFFARIRNCKTEDISNRVLDVMITDCQETAISDEFCIVEPTCANAWWAPIAMQGFLSVCEKNV